LTPGKEKEKKDQEKNKKPAKPAVPPNKVRDYRKQLGLRKVELARLSGLSEKTIQRLEKLKLLDETTYWKILKALNKARRADGLSELRFEDIFPSGTSAAD
jgi:DNA-binding XRE family transcriptional regulator